MDISLSKDTLDKIDLRKQQVISLTKAIGIGNQKAQVALVLDISISMNSLYASGLVQDVVERILPLALNFDDNGSIDVYPFHNGSHQAATASLQNLAGYVNREIVAKFQFGGTNYEPVIQRVRKAHGSGGMGLLGMFTKKAASSLPTYVIFITDGDNADHNATERAMRDASQEGIFWSFVGLGHASFSFLDRLDNLTGRKIDNASFFKANDIRSMSDQQLYSNLLKEFPAWLTGARSLGFIK